MHLVSFFRGLVETIVAVLDHMADMFSSLALLKCGNTAQECSLFTSTLSLKLDLLRQTHGTKNLTPPNCICPFLSSRVSLRDCRSHAIPSLICRPLINILARRREGGGA